MCLPPPSARGSQNADLWGCGRERKIWLVKVLVALVRSSFKRALYFSTCLWAIIYVETLGVFRVLMILV